MTDVGEYLDIVVTKMLNKTRKKYFWVVNLKNTVPQE